MGVIDQDAIRGYWDENCDCLTCVECAGESDVDTDVDHILQVSDMEDGKRYFCDQCKTELVAE